MLNVGMDRSETGGVNARGAHNASRSFSRGSSSASSLRDGMVQIDNAMQAGIYKLLEEPTISI
jgi:hypothetical protein